MIKNKIKVIVVVARGEAVRNFVFTKFLKILSNKAEITLFTSVHHPQLIESSKNYVKQVMELNKYDENPLVNLIRQIIHTAHYRWINTQAVKYYWGRHDNRVKNNLYEYLKLKLIRIISLPFSNRIMLRIGNSIDRWLSIKLRPKTDFELLYDEIRPDFVFNCSHIHGVTADLPLRVAKHLNIPTGVFLFSWDNLSSRSRILPEYDKYFVWTKSIKNHLINLYEGIIEPNQVFITGTPQFDFHFDKKYKMEKSKFFKNFGLDSNRPYILYTTGKSSDFPDEHLIIIRLIKHLKTFEPLLRPQLVVRTYIKGTSSSMLSLANNFKQDKDIFFPEILWDSKWTMPLKEDLYIYTNLLRYSSLGINTASTTTLELMMFQKPTINIGFEPPGANLPSWSLFARHVSYEHFIPVIKGRGTMVAKSMNHLISLVEESLEHPKRKEQYQKRFLNGMFGDSLDDKSSLRIVDAILS